VYVYDVAGAMSARPYILDGHPQAPQLILPPEPYLRTVSSLTKP
jgi:hypothetical protein